MSKTEEPKMRMETRIARETWDYLARENAMHFIASVRSEWREEDFFESGREMATRLLQQVRPRTGAGTSMCDVGCGIGRLAFAFASYFDRVIGLDISPEMIDRAQQYKKKFQVKNVEFRVSNGADIADIADATQDFVFSHLVFLHLASRSLIRSYFREFSRVLRPGAPAFFDMGVASAGLQGSLLYSVKELRDWVYKGLYLLCGPKLGIRSPAVRGKRVTVGWLTAALQEANCRLVSIGMVHNSWTHTALIPVICRRS